MGEYVLKESKIYLGGYNLSGSLNRVALRASIDPKEVTAFGDTSKDRLAGLWDVQLAADGYWEGSLDNVLFGKLAVLNEVLTIGPETGAVGERGFGFKGVQAEYGAGEAIGNVLPFNLVALGQSPLVRGTIMENGAKTVTGSGTARQLGAVSATQKLYASFHVTAVAGTNPTLDMLIQSDDGVGFASPTTRITFTQVTAIGAQWATPVAGPITDDWWRASWTIGGTGSPSFTVVVLVAIQ